MRVAIIGASTNPEKYGYRSVEQHLASGHEVLPVNPRATEILGQKVYHSIGEVPGHLDRVVLYLPSKLGEAFLEELIERGDFDELWVSPGAESEALIARAKEVGIMTIQACSIVDVRQH